MYTVLWTRFTQVEFTFWTIPTRVHLPVGCISLHFWRLPSHIVILRGNLLFIAHVNVFNFPQCIHYNRNCLSCACYFIILISHVWLCIDTCHRRIKIRHKLLASIFKAISTAAINIQGLIYPKPLRGYNYVWNLPFLL